MSSPIKIKNLKKSIITLIILILAFFAINPGIALASKTIDGLLQTAGQAFGDKSNVKTEAELAQAGVITSIPTAVGKFVGALLAFLGIMFLVLIIYGGFVWMFARGNEQEATKAKGIIESAVIGLVIVLAAYAITAYLGQALTTK